MDNSTLPASGDVIRDKDRAGVKTQVVGLDLGIGGGSEVLCTAAALADAAGNPTTVLWGSCPHVYNGTTWDRARGDTANGLDVDVTRLPALPAGTNNIGDIDVLTLPALPAGTNNIGDVDVLSLPALPAGSNVIGTVNGIGPPGRTELRFYAVAAAAGATGVETAITLTKSSGTGATSTGTSFVITSGKKFRITHISVATRGHATATIQTTTFSLRVNTAGAVTTTSTPVILAARSATPATASAWDRYVIPLGDGGLEIPGDGTLQFGVTAAATFTTNAPTWDVTLIGYEY
jgi:hypothetical protein